MHPDLKVGLALAMLILGFAGAMCFRLKPPEEKLDPVTLRLSHNVDPDLELLPIRTYREPASPAEATATGSGPDSTPARDDERDAELSSPPVEILPISGSEGPLTEGTRSVDSSSARGDVGQNGSPHQFDTDQGATPYQVRPGDTLSGIAARMLGSTQRYHEIFEANRSILRSPDDLRPGMTLMIPPRQRREVSPVSAEDPTDNIPPHASPETPPAGGSDRVPSALRVPNLPR